jgi:hypothetical protein
VIYADKHEKRIFRMNWKEESMNKLRAVCNMSRLAQRFIIGGKQISCVDAKWFELAHYFPLMHVKPVGSTA